MVGIGLPGCEIRNENRGRLAVKHFHLTGWTMTTATHQKKEPDEQKGQQAQLENLNAEMKM